ncbi:hypothetical protein HYH03_016668 [Edaphochlamys debaryana]|uniref:Uncharacterized protein n=1 Tax=Edaphochlamys debaryana TaxID=47281 RepID=A0A835XJG9_9CHLO|nr:hypothetical protein HYH03_016668 [Edaphochlamys debaryana]|eukprot:KAG2484530.1 hypothetical protein HYH03_016668 [Edaphochlamys debaryana]
MDALAVAPLLPPVVAPLKAASSILHSPGSPPLLGCVARLAHIVWDGTVESFGTIADHLRERLGPRGAEPFATPLDGKVCIVTGGNAGIGFATARALARRGAHVVLACRDRERAQAAAEAIARTPPLPGCCGTPSPSPSPSPPAPPPPLSVEALPLDLGRMASVRAFAADWRRGGRRLDLIVCNAGVMGPPRRLETADGLEVQFQVNFLSHWLLANQLLQIEHERRQRAKAAPPPSAAAASKQLPLGATAGGAGSALPLSARAGGPHSPSPSAGLEAEGPGQEGEEEEAVRVVMVSSLTHRAGALQWGDKQSKNRYEPFLSYGLSKLANTLTARELQRRFDRSPQHRGYTAVAVHPGLVSTALANGFFTGVGTGWAADWRAPLRPLAESATECFGRLLGPLLMRTPDQSATIMLAACLGPRGAVAGRYLALGTPTRPDEYAEDEGRARELWAYAQELTGCPPALD